jgi:hypothetical protein
MGDFDINEHTAADNLKWMVDQINEHISFWKMTPTHYTYTRGNETSIFQHIHDTSRALQWKGNEYVIGTDRQKDDIIAKLPEGVWRVVQFDIINKSTKVIAEAASGNFTFDVPDSRAVITFFEKQ